MPKLHLKRTPEEEALRKKEKKAAKRRRRLHGAEPGSWHPRKRPRTTEDPLEPERKWASSDEEQYGPQPAPSASHSSRSNMPDQEELRAEVEEMRFREKLLDAFADDERLESLEARLNDVGHVPDRWRAASTSARYNVFEDDGWLKMNPQTMDEEEYAEWIRMGMYRKTHASEYAEQQRQAARRAEEKARKAETARLEQAAEEERKRKKRERDARQWANARDEYHTRWKRLLSGNGGADILEAMSFRDIPWPVLHAHLPSHRSETVGVSVDDLTVEAISAFLLPGDENRKEVLRETLLRFHPDKFEGRIMRLVCAGEQARVREGIGRVVRALNTLGT